MKKWLRLLGVVLAAGLLVGISFSAVVFGQDMVNISPQTLNLVEFGGEEITVHISIDYIEGAIVEMVSDDGSSISIQALYIFADYRGDLVAKFSLEDVEDIVEEGENTLTLYVDDDEIGTDNIQVISGGMKKGK